MFFAELGGFHRIIFQVIAFLLTVNALGAEDGGKHWSFVSPQVYSIPKVKTEAWVKNEIDNFILADLEGSDITPAKKAEPAQLIRRIYYDLIGLPPSLEKVEEFLKDHSPEAFTRIVNNLLDSPQYGERWGRHWLDVARYGDSNGGDENHAYPHAWRYRNYVIDAFNSDLPYNEFITEQLAGDLLESNFNERSRRVTATGFLAIGTKILAEKDGVKKRADIIDEQIDTVSRSFMGISVSCARCHDHKFDPIPTADYYALAGIFHSTKIEDQSLSEPEDEQREAKKKSRLELIGDQLDDLESKFSEFVDEESIVQWEAEKFIRGNVSIIQGSNDNEATYISDPGSQENFAEYKVKIQAEGTYSVDFRYAAERSRPGSLIIDGDKGKVISVLADVTGGWSSEYQRWNHEAYIHLNSGEHVFRVESKPLMSHLDRIRLTRVRSLDQVKSLRLRIDNLKNERAGIQADKNNTYKVMAVQDGDVADTNINLRGDPHEKGELVPRGFLSKVSPRNVLACDDGSSGRLELAKWMTQPDHPLTARVIVNRIWYWHFGKGIVSTVDDFGTTGTEPSHPELLDYLANDFVRNGWSIKMLHRKIMFSNTYQMGADNSNSLVEKKDPGNSLYWHRDVRRLEAESFRDSVLMVSGNLNMDPPSSPLVVKSQDPSPSDLLKNRQSYENYQYRSVYLPVVRSHLYDLLTLLGFPNATTTVGQRSQTTVPTQALLMMNNPFLIRQAQSLALRIGEGKVRELYLTLFSRVPNSEEMHWISRFINKHAKISGKKKAWESLCHTLLISNEFLHVW
ncbi:DUF1553 domain-containing protein [Verrucomicrobiales bacterium]|nr:DUF1553 domain-containing protein [Verrucomicrobiales bacterium]